MTTAEAQKAAAEFLAANGIESSRFEAGQIVRQFSEDGCVNEELLSKALHRRAEGEPLQYILGEWEFYGLRFLVGEGVLIPRPDTETLADIATEFIGSKKLRCIDLCSGSGCVAVAVAKNCKNAEVTALEKSEKAFDFLLKNIELNKVKVTAQKGDVSMPFGLEYDVLVSNPPYIESAALPRLQREVSFEPKMALDGGLDGLDFYRIIAEKWFPRLRPGGLVAVEIGMGQQEAVKKIFEAAGLAGIGERKDLCGIVRVIFGTVPEL